MAATMNINMATMINILTQQEITLNNPQITYSAPYCGSSSFGSSSNGSSYGPIHGPSYGSSHGPSSSYGSSSYGPSSHGPSTSHEPSSSCVEPTSSANSLDSKPSEFVSDQPTQESIIDDKKPRRLNKRH